MKEQTDDPSPESLAHLRDGELLTRFLRRQDQGAFRAIVARHGSMVMAVCRGILRCEQDAEDACQATFLVLAENARRIRRRTSLASWLHGVAYRICWKARIRIQRRKEQVIGDSMIIADETLVEIARQHEQSVLHEELNGLPEKYRAVLVICYMQGKSREEAARQLGCTVGAVKGRLERGRQALRTRLLARGVASGMFIGVVGSGAANQALAESFINSIVEAAIAQASGQGAVSGVSSQVAALAQGELSLMSASLSTKMLVASVSSVALLSVCLLLLMLPQAARADKPAERVIAIQTTGGLDDADSPDSVVIAQAPGEGKDKNDQSTENEKNPSRGQAGKRIWTPDEKSPQNIHVGGRMAEALAFLRGGKQLVSAGWDYTEGGGDQDNESWKQGKARGVLKLWDREKGESTATFIGSCGAIFDVAVSPDEKLIATAGRVENTRRGGEVKIWDVASKAEIATLKGHTNWVLRVAFSPDSKRVVTGGFDGHPRVWDVKTGKLIATLPKQASIRAICFRHDGKKLLTATGSGIVTLWDTRMWGGMQSSIKLEEFFLLDAEFSPDGNLIALAGAPRGADAGRTGEVRIWDAKNLKRIAGFSTDGIVSSLSFSPDGRFLAAVSMDRLVRIWNVKQAKEVAAIDRRGGSSSDTVLFAPDGKLSFVTRGVVSVVSQK